MDADTIRTALGELQVNPESTQAWSALETAALASDRESDLPELLRLVGAARSRHQERGEWEAVALLLDLESRVNSDPGQLAQVLTELARVHQDELIQQEAAETAYQRLLEVDARNAHARTALSDSEAKRERWQELSASYQAEADDAPDDVYKSSMLMRSAEVEVRYAGAVLDLGTVLERLSQSTRLDPSNAQAGRMLERLYRRSGRTDEAIRVLERLATRSESSTHRIQAGIRLARFALRKAGETEIAVQAYERVLNDVPDHQEAMEFLAGHYAEAERWQELVNLFEKELKVKDLSNAERLGDMLQIAMLHWKKLTHSQDAEPWFERIRQLDPAHDSVLAFFREYCAELSDDARLIQVLQTAQRVMPEGQLKASVSSELARLAEGQANAQKAIEQYKAVLRQDPDNEEARSALKRLYTQTQGYNALVELLRQQLERTDASAYESRLGILREVASVYRSYLKSDTALVSVLNQIVQLDDKLDEHDVEELRELISLYDKLGRWRDLLTYQLKLAEVTPDVAEKKALFRAAARRWLDQFSNFQHATEAYEALLRVEPKDEEARERLQELYRKRRAWPALYELFERDLTHSEGAERLTLMKDMAQLAAERLGRTDDAMRLYKTILEEDPSRKDVLDALERFAERNKEWAILGEALERRVDLTEDAAAKVTVLQKLGTVYAEHLSDKKGAVGVWQRVLGLQPGHHRALRVLRDSLLEAADYEGLEALYASQNDWEGLAEVLSNAADRIADPRTKIDLSYRAARVFEQELTQPDRAFRSYERVLAVDSTDTRAASALVPLYEEDEKWARLPPLYELLVEQSEDRDTKLELLQRLVDVTAQKLSDRKAGVAYARQAYALAPSSPVALAMLEAATQSANAPQDLAEAFEQRLKAPLVAESAESEAQKGRKRTKKKKGSVAIEPEVSSDDLSMQEARELRLRLARIYDQQLNRTDDAVATYKRMLEASANDEQAIEELETILRRDGRRDDLRWLFEWQVEHALRDSARIGRLRVWAELEETAFDSADRSVELLRRLLTVDASDDAALRTLARLLKELDRMPEAAEIIEQHRDLLDGAPRFALEVELAELYSRKLARPRDALDAAVRALEFDAAAPRPVAVVEELLDNDAARADAARVLAGRYATGGEARREAQALGIILDQATEAEERLSLYKRLTSVHKDKLASSSAALNVTLRAVREFPTDFDLWDSADELAASSGRPQELAEVLREVLREQMDPEIRLQLCERAAKVHTDRLGDPLGAVPHLEKVLELDPTLDSAFVRLKDILTGAERWSELESLYERTAAAVDDLGRRVEMLAEVALICEEIIEDPAKTTKHYESILELDPLHETALLSLDRLYVKQERFEDLAKLLARRHETLAGEEANDLALRLARIQLNNLHQPDSAMGLVEQVLAERPNDYEARELAERLLGIGSMQGRAARALEVVYEARDEIRDLVRVLRARREASLNEAKESGVVDQEDQKEVLRRIATLEDERLHDDAAALSSLAELVPMDAVDEHVRKRLIDIGRRQGEYERVVNVLLKAADTVDVPGTRGEILMEAAAIELEQVADPSAAEATYRTVLALDPRDSTLVLPAASALQRIYRNAQQFEKLADMLRIQVRLENEPDRRRVLLGELGELCQSTLNDLEGAVAAWRTRLEEDSGDKEAMLALDRLYLRLERWQELVNILDLRRDFSDGGDERRELMCRIARIHGDKLRLSVPAIEAWQAVHSEFGPSAESLNELEKLFVEAERWEDLGETFETHLEHVDDDAQRLELLADLADLKRTHLNNPAEALQTYRRALTEDMNHRRSRDAVTGMLGAEDAMTRREAAEILRPIYESEADHPNLLKVIEVEIDTADDPLSRVEHLANAVTVAEEALGDRDRAFVFACRALKEAAGHSELEPWLGQVDRLAESVGKRKEQVELLSAVVADIFDGDVQLSVTLKIAELARYQLGDRETARDYYRKALELRADEPRALAALESLYEELDDPASLLEVLGRRAEIAEGDSERKRLLYRRAKLLAERMDDAATATEVYETILDIDLEAESINALEGLYAKQERWTDLVELFQRQLDMPGAPKPALHVKIAGVAANHQNDWARALDEFEQALSLERQHPAAVEALEVLLETVKAPEYRARTAALLEPVYLQRADFAKLGTAIEARLEYGSDPEEKRELLGRLAKLHEEQNEDYVAALETTAKLFHEDIAASDVRSELERLAKVAGAESRLAEIYCSELGAVSVDDPNSAELARRTGELLDSAGKLEEALSYTRRALAFEPESRSLFEAVDGLLVRSNRPVERVELYRQTLDHRYESEDRLALLHTMAAIQRLELQALQDSIETYRAALEVEETDVVAADALTELYRETRLFDDLAELHLKRAEMSEDPEESAKFRLALAAVLRTELGDTTRAIDQLEEITRSQPTHREALKELEDLRANGVEKQRVIEILRPLYEASDEWQRLISLNQDRFDLAEDTVDQLAVLQETAQLFEQRARKLDKARAAYAAAVAIEPEDVTMRGEYERLVDLTDAWEELAQRYEAVLEERPDLMSKRDLLLKIAEVHDRHRDDPRRALETYGRLHATDESDIEPLLKMERLATLLSDWAVLVEVLSKKAELLLEDEERASTWRRVGEARRDMLEDNRGAILAYERAYEIEPDSIFTVDCLIDLLEDGDQDEHLVELSLRRVDLAGEDDIDLKYDILLRAAKTIETKLHDNHRTIETLNQALAIRPDDPAVLLELARLYRGEQLWSDLLDNLGQQIALASEPAERSLLRRQMAEILSEKQQAFDDALDTYRLVLEDAPDDVETILAARRIGQDHEELRETVAQILVPVLELGERFDALVNVLEMRLTAEHEPTERVETLRAIARVHERSLGSNDDALGAMLRALSEQPDAPELHEEIARLAPLCDGWQRYAEALSERAQSTFEAEVARDLWQRLGRVAELHLGDVRRAVSAYERALEQAGDQPELLAALDRLYASLGEYQLLSEILERRTVAELGDTAQAELYFRLARLQLDEFKEPPRALASLRMVLDRAPDHSEAVAAMEGLTALRDLFDEAAEVLEQVYRTHGDTARLAALYEKRVSHAGTAAERADMRRDLARVLEDDCQDPAGAQRVVQQGLADSLSDEALFDEIERLADITSDWKGAAVALNQALDEATGLPADLGRDLSMRLAMWQRDRAGDAAAAEMALTRALGFEPGSDEVLLQLEELQRQAGRVDELIGTLRTRAKLQLDEYSRIELYKEAKGLADERGDALLSEALLRELLEMDELNLWALGELCGLCKAAGAQAETYDLLIKRGRLEVDGQLVRALRSEAAELARGPLNRPEDAIELYLTLYDDDPMDRNASDALDDLYTKTERWAELGTLLERLEERAETSSERADIRIRLAKLVDERSDDPERAIDVLRSVLDDEPGHSEAVVALSALLEKTERDQELAELLDTQIAAAAERGDIPAELRFRVRLGEIYASRLNDRDRAVRSYRGVLDRDSHHAGALDALTRLHLEAGERAEAVTMLEQLALLEEGEAKLARLITLADCYGELGQDQGAVSSLERALELDGTDAGIRSRLRVLYEAAESWDRLADFLVADATLVEGADEKVALLLRAAEIHVEKRHDSGRQAELLEQASELKPDDREILLQLCDAHSASGRGEAAVAALQKIVESYGTRRSKELVDIHRRLANAYLATGDSAAALDELNRAFRIEPGNVGVLKRLGEVALETGDLPKAQQMFRALLLQRLDASSPITKAEVFYRLGDVHSRLGEKPKAMQNLERALQQDPNLEAAKILLAELKG